MINQIINKHRLGLIKAKQRGKEKASIDYMLSLLNRLQGIHNCKPTDE